MTMTPPPGGPHPYWPPPAFPEPAPPPGNRGLRVLVIAVLVVVVAGYAAALVLTREHWVPGARTEDRVRVTWEPAEDSGTTPESLDRARGVIGERVAAQGVGGARTTVDGDTITLSVPGTDDQRWRHIGGVGRLDLRPVIQSTPAQEDATPLPREPRTPTAQEISDEKQLRQSTDPAIQLLALQFQATRCDGDDVLAGQDDPGLPLITCSRDGEAVYLLGGTVIDGDQIEDAAAEFDQNADQWAVDVELDGDATDRWADFTAGNVGTQAAFTLDTAVVSAPEIREAIPGGYIQITGDFDADDARSLAAALDGGTLPFPLTVSSATTENVPVQTNSTPWRIGLVAAGAVVALLTAGGTLLAVAVGRRGATGPPPGYAADVTR